MWSSRPTDDGLQPTDERPPCVLLADDDDVLRLVLARQLRRSGFEVFATACGAEAVEMFCRSAGRIDLVVLDVNMPGLNGPATLEAIRAADAEARCCFITADPWPETRESLLARGALEVFGKPFPSVSELCNTLRCLAAETPAGTRTSREGGVRWTS